MPPDRLCSIVPMFGGATNYVETLDTIIDYVDKHTPRQTNSLASIAGVRPRLESRLDHASR